jgi:hypothetical protein
VIDETTSPGKEKAAAKQRNALLTRMANLTMAFETKGLLWMIYKAMSNDWPAGLAYQVGKCGGLWHRRERGRGERKKERKGEKERKREELVISMRVPSFFEILRTLA